MDLSQPYLILLEVEGKSLPYEFLTDIVAHIKEPFEYKRISIFYVLIMQLANKLFTFIS